MRGLSCGSRSPSSGTTFGALFSFNTDSAKVEEDASEDTMDVVALLVLAPVVSVSLALFSKVTTTAAALVDLAVLLSLERGSDLNALDMAVAGSNGKDLHFVDDDVAAGAVDDTSPVTPPFPSASDDSVSSPFGGIKCLLSAPLATILARRFRARHRC